jgi:hypothetical protein
VYADPLELFRDAVAALNKADWRAVAAFCDPASLRVFKRKLIDLMTLAPEQAGQITTHELMRAVPNMPRAVAEYQVAQFRESVNPKRRLNAEVPSVKSREELEAMTPAAVFAAWVDGKSLRRQVDREVSRGRLTRASAAQVLEEARATFDFRGLAFVPDGDRIGYVIYRYVTSSQRAAPADDGSADKAPDDVEFMRDVSGHSPPMSSTVRRQSDGGWLLVADTDFLTVSQMQVIAGADDGS